MDTWDWDSISTNIAMNDVRKYPHLPWSKAHLSKNKNIEIDIIDMNLPNATREWNYMDLCLNTDRLILTPNMEVGWDALSYCIPTEYVRKYPHLPWSKGYLSNNNNIGMDILLLDLPNSTGDWCMDILSTYIDMKDIRQHLDMKWDRNTMSTNVDLTIDDVMNLDMPNATDDWNWRSLSRTTPIHYVVSYPHFPWCKNSLSRNRKITFSIMNMNLPNSTGEWDDDYLSRYIPISEIIGNLSYPWVWKSVSRRDHISITDILPIISRFSTSVISSIVSMEDIRLYPHLEWNRLSLSWNRNLEIDIILLDLPNATHRWNWQRISSNANISDVRKYPNLPWHREYLHLITDSSIIYDNLPQAVGEWNWNSILKEIDVHEYPYLPIECKHREYLSYLKNLSIQWMNIIDKNVIHIDRFSYRGDIDFFFLS
jgi:hypothetical protein